MGRPKKSASGCGGVGAQIHENLRVPPPMPPPQKKK